MANYAMQSNMQCKICNMQCGIPEFHQSALASPKIVITLSQTISKYWFSAILLFGVGRLFLFYNSICHPTIFLVWYRTGFFIRVTTNISLREEEK